MKSEFVEDDFVINIFVAATEAEWLPTRVLEFSIRETTQVPVKVAPIYTFSRQIPIPLALENRPRTPFSFQRFLIPELCGFKGKAIYLDADMQVFQDISKLWNYDFNGCQLQTVSGGNNGRRGQFSVMLLDCARLNWNVDRIVADLDYGRLDYATLMYEMKVAERIGYDIPSYWNALETYDALNTCLLHFTDMNTQPWISVANPLGYLWVACLRKAVNANFISRQELEREINCGHVRPSLIAQIDENLDDCIALPARIRKLDVNFIAPYKHIKSRHAKPWTSLAFAGNAYLRRIYYASFLARILEK